MQLLIPPLWKKALQQHAVVQQRHAAAEQARQQKLENDLAEWEAECDAAKRGHEEQRAEFLRTQSENNDHIQYFIEQYEAGNPGAIKGYLEEVFGNAEYPESFPVEHEISFDADTATAVIDISLPCQDALPATIDYKFKKTTRTGEPVDMKSKDHDELYDSAVKQSVLRTLHTAIAATKPDGVSGAVVNGWVTYLDKATGTDKTSCVISVSADRQKLEEINLERVDPTECIKSLKGLVAGPLSQVAPVQLNREDSRFVESQAVLAEINATTNLAEIGWEEFEHLVRELFNEMFSENGAEVKVTQASSDGGVDAIAFDPDPIRGGKFVIQAKRYTKVVPVSAVRDLYGTMISEGASKGLLVTTAHYGRDSREFVKDKPISLIDGSNLVYLLEKYGHKVKIDVKAARSNMGRNPLAR
jgi:restriction system protein